MTNAEVIRIALSTNDPLKSVTDVIGGTTQLDFTRARDLKVQFVVTTNGTIVSVSNIASVRLEVKPLNDRTGAPLMDLSIASGALDDTTNATTWGDGSKQHGTFEFDFTETALPMSGSTTRGFWLVITATTTDTPAHKVPLFHGPVTVHESGGETTVQDVVPPDGSGSIFREITASESLSAADSGKTLAVLSGSAVVLTIPDTLPAHFWCHVIRAGTGTVTFDDDGTSVLVGAGGLNISARGGRASINRDSDEVFLIGGNLA